MSLKPVDTAIVMVVGPCIDDTDFKSLEEAIAYNAAGMDISLIVEKTDGTSAVTAITLTTGGTSDWTHKDGGYYEVEITAAQNAEEGIAYVRGVCTGVLPFESPRYDIVKANIYDSLIKGTDTLQTDLIQIGGVVQSLTDFKDMVDTGYDPATHKIQSDLIYIHGTALTETDGQLAAAFKKLFDVATPLLVASDVMRGTDGANTTVPDAAGTLATYDPPTNTEMVAAFTEIKGATWAAGTDTLEHIRNKQTDIETDTAEIGTAGAGLTDLGGMSTGMKAEIQTEANDALIAQNLDHLVKIAVDTNFATTVHLDSVIGHLADVGTSATFDRTTDAIEAIRNRGDTAWITATGFATSGALATAQTDLDTLTGADGATLATLQGNYAPNKVIPDVAGTAAGLHTTTDGKVDVVGANVDSILVDTGTTIPAQIAALDDISVADIIAGITDGTLDLQEMMRIILAATAGKSSGGGTVTLVFRDAADSKDRITATVDANGNRTAMTLDGA